MVYLSFVSAKKILKKKQVKKIKRSIREGVALIDLANEYEVTYITIYKIAAGITWKKVKPRGRLIGFRDYDSRRVFTLARCEALALIKIRKKLSNATMAKKIHSSESTVRRAIDDGKLSLGLKFNKLLMNGNAKAVMKRLELSKGDVENLIALSSKKDIPEWIRREVER